MSVGAEDRGRVLIGYALGFETEAAVKSAAQGAASWRLADWDVMTPYPVHGLDKKIGVKETPLPLFTLAYAILGGVGGFAMQAWMNGVDYQYLISGKPLIALPNMVPIIFECAVLAAGVGTFLTMWVLNRLPHFWTPQSESALVQRSSDDLFVLWVPMVNAEGKRLDHGVEGLEQRLQALGAAHYEEVSYHEARFFERVPSIVRYAFLLMPLLAALGFALGLGYALSYKTKPRIHLVHDMDHQAKYKSQTANLVQDFGFDFVSPLADTRDFITREAPPPVSQSLVERGQSRYLVHCATCHGAKGKGEGPVALRAQGLEGSAWVPPPTLVGTRLAEESDDYIYEVISAGKGMMPAYGSRMVSDDRWAIVAYVRALQNAATRAREGGESW